MRTRLNGLLSEEVDNRISRFVWLRQFEVGETLLTSIANPTGWSF